MRIRHILPQPEMGVLPSNPPESPMTGVVKAAWHLAVEQSRLGHRVEIVCPVERGPSQKEAISGVTVHRLALWRGLRIPRVELSYLLPLFLFGVSAEKVDVAHVHANPFHSTMLRCRTLVIHLHGLPVAYLPAHDRAIGRADAVICCSHYVARELARSSSYPSGRVQTIHNGVDAGAVAAIDRVRARARYDLGRDTIAILFAGRFAPEKGLHVLVDAMRRVVEAGARDVVLLAAGSSGLGAWPVTSPAQRAAADPGWSAFDQELRARSSGQPIRFVGSLGPQELAEFYCAGDIFACPSICQDAFPLANVEAAAAGLPIVASAIGGIPEAVSHETNGLLVKAGDAGALAQALLTLIADPDMRRRMGSASREIGLEHDWRTIASQVEAVYTWARQGHRARAVGARQRSTR